MNGNAKALHLAFLVEGALGASLSRSWVDCWLDLRLDPRHPSPAYPQVKFYNPFHWSVPNKREPPIPLTLWLPAAVH